MDQTRKPSALTLAVVHPTTSRSLYQQKRGNRRLGTTECSPTTRAMPPPCSNDSDPLQNPASTFGPSQSSAADCDGGEPVSSVSISDTGCRSMVDQTSNCAGGGEAAVRAALRECATRSVHSKPYAKRPFAATPDRPRHRNRPKTSNCFLPGKVAKLAINGAKEASGKIKGPIQGRQPGGVQRHE